MKFIFLLTILLASGCSILTERSEYKISNTSEAQPVCTIWNSKDGAAVSSLLDTTILIKPPTHTKTRLFGPLLLPFIPTRITNKLFSANVEIQFIPKEGDLLTFQVSQTEIFFDDHKIDIQNAQYRKTNKLNNERTNGELTKDQFSNIIHIGQPYSITLEAGLQPLPKYIEIVLSLQKGTVKETKSLKFVNYDYLDYRPFIFPAMELDAVCMTTIPNFGKKRDLL